MRLFLLCLILFGLGISPISGAPLDEARKLYKNGDYSAAVEKLKVLKKSSPRDGNVNYYLGASLVALGRSPEAVAPLKIAEDRGVTDASRLLVEIALDDYDTEGAEEHLDIWSDKLKKNKKTEPAGMDELRKRMVMLSNMLDRVEKIEIVDSLNVDASDFFTHYRLSPEAGRLLLPDVGFVCARTLLFFPTTICYIFWAQRDSTGTAVLMSASILDDGTIDNATPLKGNFSEGGDADYPFLMPDGMTLYYSATGDASLGGYEIFMTRRSDDGYLQPQNIGMPYNSPYNDYMLAIDEATGAGWFASDRGCVPGKVTIYVFVPSQTRVNYDVDDPSLHDKARIKSIDSVRSAEASALRQRIAAIDEGGSRRGMGNSRFEISMGNGKVYTSLDDFSSRQARQEMKELLVEQEHIDAQIVRLNQLRERYRGGEKNLADQIADAETAIEYGRQKISEWRNKVIRLETK